MTKKRIVPRHASFGNRLAISLVFIVLFLTNSVASADHPAYGPRLEVGGGLTANWPQSRPDWSSKFYNGGFATGAFRIYEGLSIQASQIYSVGDISKKKWIGYGDNKQIKMNKKAYSRNSRFGVRYEIPMSVFKASIFGIDFTYISVSMNYLIFGVASDSIEIDGGVKKLDGANRYKLADVSGPSVALAARWRFDTVDTGETQPWFGAYGADLGVRYTNYNDSTVKFDTITEPVPGFNTVEIFVVGFIKFKLFY